MTNAEAPFGGLAGKVALVTGAGSSAAESFQRPSAHGSGNAMFGVLVDALIGILDGSAIGIDYPHKRREAVLAAHERIAARCAPAIRTRRPRPCAGTSPSTSSTPSGSSPRSFRAGDLGLAGVTMP